MRRVAQNGRTTASAEAVQIPLPYGVAPGIGAISLSVGPKRPKEKVQYRAAGVQTRSVPHRKLSTSHRLTINRQLPISG